MNSKFSHAKNVKLVQMALLIALVVVLQLCFSAVRIGPVTLSFVLVPIVVAGVFLGPLEGMILGAVAGLTTFVQVFTSGDPFYVFLMTTNPFMTFILCVIKTGAAGLLAGILYRVMNTVSKYRTLNVIVPAVICPVTNTGIFCLGMLAIFGNALTQDATFGAAASENLVSFVFVGLVGVNFFVELILNLVACPAISKALFSLKKSNIK